MDLEKLSAFYIVLLLLQVYMVYKNKEINCNIGQNTEEIKAYNYDQYVPFDEIETKPIKITQINEFWYYLSAMVIYMPLICLFKKLYDWRLQCFAKWITGILYVIINLLVIIFEYIIMGGISKLYELEYQHNVRFYDDEVDCNEGKIFYIAQLIMCVAWQILLTIIYLLQTNRLNPVITLFKLKVLVLRLVFIIISMICIIYSFYIMILESTRLEKNQFQIYSIKQIEQIELYILYISLIIAQIYLLILQILEVFTTKGSLNKRFLNFFIFSTFIISQLQIFSPFLYEKFIILYLVIQINSYQRVKVAQVQNNQNNVLTIIIYCFKCKDYITLNHSIVYFRDSIQFFHQECFNEWQITNQFQNICYYLVNLSQKSQEWYQQSKLNISILYILNFLTISFLMLDNTNVFQQSIAYVNILAQLIINGLSVFFSKRKMTSGNLLLQIVVFIGYCVNLISIYTFYEENQQNFRQSFPHGNKYYLEQFNNNIYLFIYDVLITLIYAYQISYLIILERIQSGSHKVMFFAFILMNIQSVVFFVLKVQFNYIDWMCIIIYILNLLFLILFISKKLQCIARDTKIVIKKYNGYIKNIFNLKVIALGILLLLAVFKLNFPKTSQDQYFDFFYLIILHQQVTNDEIVKFSYIIINIQFIFYLLYLYCQEAKQLLENELTKFNKIDELERPIIGYAENCSRCQQIFQNGQVVYYNLGCEDFIHKQCSRCQQIFQNGQVVYYNLECKHFIHKQCIRVEWMNYKWCCQESGNKVIEIHLN